jgi:carbon storage regulator
MLVLARKKGQALIINENIEISVLEVGKDIVKIGIDAPRSVSILRKELYEEISTENVEAAKTMDIPWKKMKK